MSAQPSALERAAQFYIRSAKLPTAQMEYRFCDRLWRFDFAWPEFSVALEVEGGTWTQGRHVRGTGFAKDLIKYNEAALQGWLVIRVTEEHLTSGEAMAWLTRALEARRGR